MVYERRYTNQIYLSTNRGFKQGTVLCLKPCFFVLTF